ncbi:MAG: 7-carboxy-7-deazaguanine synthase QueE [Thermofilum sp.]
MSKIKYIEIFYSIQGEGVNFGVPSIFLRLPYCNLRCEWCDTKYSLEPEKVYEDEPEPLCTFLAARNSVAKNVVITGGEPMLQKSTLAELLKLLKDKGMKIEIETNGTIEPEQGMIGYVDCFNVSPKLSNSGVNKGARITKALKSFAKLAEAGKAWFKFVVKSEEDVIEAMDEVIVPYNILLNRVILMPLTIDGHYDRSQAAKVIELCKKYGFRFSPRIQVEVYGNRRLV